MKKGINKKEIEKITAKMQNNGISKSDIYNELKEKYFDNKRLAIIIASQVSIERKRKYKLLNTTLLILFSIASLYKIVTLIVLFNNVALIIVSSIIIGLIAYWFILQINKHRPFIYSFISIFIILQELKYVLEKDFLSTWSMIELFFYLFIAVLSFIVKSKLFPKYGLFRPLYDRNGNVYF